MADTSEQEHQTKAPANGGEHGPDNGKAAGSRHEKGSSKDEKSAGEGKGDQPGRRSRKPLIVLIIIVVVLAIIAAVWWFLTRNDISTDDAYTEGDAVTIAPKVGGYVTGLDVSDNTRVHRGDLLLRIDPRDYAAARDQAQAQVALADAQLHQARTQLALAEVQYPAQLAQAQAQEQAAQADLANARASYRRQHNVDPRATSQQNVDTATAQMRSAVANVARAQAEVKAASVVQQQVAQARALVEARQAQLRAAQAQLEQADLNLSYTDIRAPTDGWVTRRNVQDGKLVQAGMSLFSLVPPTVWIAANFKETQLERMRPGDKVEIEVDAYPQLKLHGHVDSVQLGSGSRFSAFPAENATGNFVKIVQRVPVKIVIDDGLDPSLPLLLGLSVTPTVHVR